MGNVTVAEMSEARFAELHAENGGSEHPAGCTYGGFSCGYWLVSCDECDRQHWEQHIVINDKCACGHTFPGAGTCVVFCDATDEANG